MDEGLLDRDFYGRNAEVVAKEILGKLMVRKSSEGIASGYVVETEAYHGEEDPASRAAQNGRTDLTEPMWMKPGTIFVYMVHGHWMLNVVTGEEDKPSAVLFRALEPKTGIGLMKDRRDRDRLRELCSGPGKLTQALEVDKFINKESIYSGEDLYITQEGSRDFEVARSKRIGVSEDLDEPMRFYIEGSEFTSR